jgi:hypothetical protein
MTPWIFLALFVGTWKLWSSRVKAFSGTVEYMGRQMKQCWIKNIQKIPCLSSPPLSSCCCFLIHYYYDHNHIIMIFLITSLSSSLLSSHYLSSELSLQMRSPEIHVHKIPTKSYHKNERNLSFYIFYFCVQKFSA